MSEKGKNYKRAKKKKAPSGPFWFWPIIFNLKNLPSFAPRPNVSFLALVTPLYKINKKRLRHKSQLSIVDKSKSSKNFIFQHPPPIPISKYSPNPSLNNEYIPLP